MSVIVFWFEWYLKDFPKFYLFAYKNFLKFGINYFSTLQLLKSFFSPWKRIKVEIPKRFDILELSGAIFFNIFSRLFGAVLRTFLILIGLFFEGVILVLGLIFFILWFFWPILVILGFLRGISLIFV